MTIIPPTIGQTPWGADLNAVLTELDTRLEQISINARDRGAANDGSVNVSAIVQAAIDELETLGGGVVYFPEGVYALNVTVPSFVTLAGAGRGATQLRRATAGTPVVEMSGPSTDASGATHVQRAGIVNMTINGNGLGGPALRCYYANNLIFRDVFFTSSTERLVDAVEFWDSRFDNCQFESSGGTDGATLPGVHLRNASSATPATFGYSLDNVNQIVFSKCRWENFHNGALRIEDGSVVGNNPNTIYIVDCKMESSSLQGGEHLVVDDSCVAIWVDRLYCFAGGFGGAFSTPINIINWSASRGALENVLLANGGVASVNSGVLVFSPAGQRTVLRNIVASYGTAPTGSHIFFNVSTGAWYVENCYSGTGSQFGGTIPTAWEGANPEKLVAGVPADASFVRTPPNGAIAINSSSTALYVRVSGSWKAVIRSGRAVLAAGTVVVADTQITANSNIQLTSQVDGGTPGFLRVSARSAGVSFTILSSNAADTSTVAYTITEP